MSKIFLIYGPTGSGKSYLANYLYDIADGTIVNADSMQVYKNLKILTASPNHDDKLQRNHALYNYISLDKHYSVASYIKDVKNLLSKEKNYYIVGGTGMYISNLLDGLSDIPDIPIEIQDEGQKILSASPQNFYNILLEIDPLIKNKIHPSNHKRLLRAYEVVKYTGKSLFTYHTQRKDSVLKQHKIIKIYLKPERKFLYEICNKRFLNMINNGAIEEVESLKNQTFTISSEKIIGLKPIKDYLSNIISKEDMIEMSQKQTRNYAKRQYTWFNNQIHHDNIIEYDSLDDFKRKINNVHKIFK